MDDDDRLHTTREVAELLRVTPRTLGNWRRANLITFVKLGPRRVMYRASDVRRFLEARRSAP